MMLWAQIPGADKAIDAATGRGYEAVVLVIILLGMLAFFGALGRWFINSTDRRLDESCKREERLAARVSTLEKFVEDTLLRLVQEASASQANVLEAVRALTNALNNRLCLLDPARQDSLVDKIAERFVERFPTVGDR